MIKSFYYNKKDKKVFITDAVNNILKGTLPLVDTEDVVGERVSRIPRKVCCDPSTTMTQAYPQSTNVSPQICPICYIRGSQPFLVVTTLGFPFKTTLKMRPI